MSRARTNASADPAPAFMLTSGSTSDTPVGASLLFDPICANARAACGCTDMGFVVRGILVWVNQLWYYVRLLVQGARGRCPIHVVVPFGECEVMYDVIKRDATR